MTYFSKALVDSRNSYQNKVGNKYYFFPTKAKKTHFILEMYFESWLKGDVNRV